MNYRVWDKGKGKVFETLEQAAGYANLIKTTTGVIVAITETRSPVTHVFKEV